MPRDYSKKKPIKRPSSASPKATIEQSKNGFIYLLIGLIVGLFIAFLVYLETQPENDSKKLAHPATLQAQKKHSASRKQNSKRSTKKVTRRKSKAEKKQVPQYQFYTMLPDVEVEVNVPDIANQRATKISSTKTVKPQPVQYKKAPPLPLKKTLYHLQVGAFASKGKAESMKAQLAFMGVQSNISSSTLNNGKKVYKVRIGPTSDDNKLKLIKAKLKRMHMNTFLHKL